MSKLIERIKITKKLLLTSAFSGIVLLVVPLLVSAAILTVGNDTISRPSLDTFVNFAVIDTNHPATASGTLSSFSYLATTTDKFRFLLVDAANKVMWVGDEIAPTIGTSTYATTSVPIDVGWNIGLYFAASSSIPFEATGTPARYTANNSGLPAIGQTLSIFGTSTRTYSIVANGSTATSTLPGILSAEDFGVVNYDTGMGILRGYTAGFGLTDATFANVQSVVVRLYANSTLLQTNTATAKLGNDITGVQISSPFDVFGTFNYSADGYWINARGSEYGQHLIPNKVVATVVLANGKTVTAQNTNLTGNPSSIFPPGPTSTTSAVDQCKNDGWKNFTNPVFKNQGQCISFVMSATIHARMIEQQNQMHQRIDEIKTRIETKKQALIEKINDMLEKFK